MYKMVVKALLRRAMSKVNDGDPQMLLSMAAPDCVLTFPGDNSWSAMHRPIARGRHRFITHRGAEEAQAFADRFVAEGIQVVVEDILVNGYPWNTRVALRAHNYIPGPDGTDLYNNRYVDIIEIRWGRMVSMEIYEDSERVAAWDEGLTLV